LDDSLQWDGRDERGNPVASGVYLVELTMNGAPVVGQKTRITVLH
jgi:flagellar hook assembly protein FlgD